MTTNQLFDPIRKLWVSASPEECVRQKWLEVMIDHLSFPKELIIVEQEIARLPHLQTLAHIDSLGRVDILAYMKVNEGLMPLLLIECKEIPLSEKALLQVRGYNAFIKAPFMAIANETEIQLGFEEASGTFSKLDFLPAYPLLIKAIS